MKRRKIGCSVLELFQKSRSKNMQAATDFEDAIEQEACAFELGSLKQLSEATQGVEAREKLACSPLLLLLAEHLLSAVQTGSPQEKLVYILRVLRNVTACGPGVALQLLDLNVHAHTAEIVLRSEDKKAIKVGGQLLANMSASGKAQAAAVWGACWPDTFQWMAKERLDHVAGPLCMILYNCCSASEALTGELLSPDGQAVMEPLLELLSDPQGIGDVHLEMLVSLLSFQTGSIPGLPLCATGPVTRTQSILPSLRDWHAGVLHALTQTLEQQSCQQRMRAERGDSLAAAVLLLMDTLARKDVTMNSHSVAILESGTKLLRTIMSLDDEGARLAGGQAAVSLLVSHHSLVKVLLSMLAALGPVKARRPDKAAAHVWPANPALQPSLYIEKPPYTGYRTDLVAVLANAAYRRQAVHDQMQSLGGVELILAHCQVDDESPFLREVALWGIRNLCEGDLGIQKRIEELQIMDPLDSPELQRAGLKVKVDQREGKA